jgi:hypothetical protein
MGCCPLDLPLLLRSTLLLVNFHSWGTPALRVLSAATRPMSDMASSVVVVAVAVVAVVALCAVVAT